KLFLGRVSVLLSLGKWLTRLRKQVGHFQSPLEARALARFTVRSYALSMNRPLTPSLSPSDGERVAGGRVRGGSWSQCMRKNERGLSMNRPTPGPSQEGNSASVPRY